MVLKGGCYTKCSNVLSLLLVQAPFQEMNLAELWQLRPIGHMKSVFHYKNGTPRQPAVCSQARGSVTIDKSVFNNPEHSLEGLEQFSHVWLVFLFHKNNNTHTKAKVRPPRLDGKRVGVFSTRSPYRPNAIGLTLAAIDQIQGNTVFVKGIDILDGTPILDIKPYIPNYDAPLVPGHQDLQKTGLCPSDGQDVQDDAVGDSLDVQDDAVGDSLDVQDDAVGRSLDSGNNVQCAESVLFKESQEGAPVEPESPSFNPGDVMNHQFENTQTGCIISDGECEETVNVESFVAGKPPEDKLLVRGSAGETTLAGLPKLTTIDSITVNKNTEPSSYPFHRSRETNESVKMPDWISDSAVRKLTVRFTPSAREQLRQFSADSSDMDYKLHLFTTVNEVEAAIQQVLNEDPRSVYRRNKCKDSLYFFSIDSVHVTCWFDENVAEVVKIQAVAVVPQCSGYR